MLAAVLAFLLPAPGALATHGGEFTISSRAADPVSYDSVFPEFTSCPAGGRAAEPIPGAQYGTGVNSLTPSTMVLGEIVPFEFRITVGGAAPFDSSIELVANWDTVTTPSGDFGYNEDYLVYCVFVDTADPDTADSGNDAAASVTSALNGTQIEGTMEVVGLDPGDVVVVEAWVVLDKSAPPSISGNVQARMISAQTLTPDVDTINVGAETTNLQPDDNFLRAIMVLKEVDAASDQTQTFDFSGAITATLGDGGVSDPVIVDDGSYDVTETVPGGWLTPSIACDDDDSTSMDATVTFIVDLETIVCTFTNVQEPVTTTTTSPTTTVAPTTTSASTTTTVATTTSTAPTLPFTGGDAGLMVGMALSLLALGGLIVGTVRSRRV